MTSDTHTARAALVFGDITNLTPRSVLRQREVSGLTDRVTIPVLCRARLHHGMISRDILMRPVIDYLQSFGDPFRVEFANADDHKVDLLLLQIPNWSDNYDTDTLLGALPACYQEVRLVGDTTSTNVIVDAGSLRREI